MCHFSDVIFCFIQYDPVLLHTSFARLLGHPKVQIKVTCQIDLRNVVNCSSGCKSDKNHCLKSISLKTCPVVLWIKVLYERYFEIMLKIVTKLGLIDICNIRNYCVYDLSHICCFILYSHICYFFAFI